VRLWKVELQKLTIKVRHCPPGRSKWKTSCTRSALSRRTGAGGPLADYAAIIDLIVATATGLKVEAVLDTTSTRRASKCATPK
jgi:Rhodopirellula transposase DDE domain